MTTLMPTTLRVARSMATDSQSRPTVRRNHSSTTKASAWVWSIWIMSSGAWAPKLPGATAAAGSSAKAAA